MQAQREQNAARRKEEQVQRTKVNLLDEQRKIAMRLQQTIEQAKAAEMLGSSKGSDNRLYLLQDVIKNGQ